MSDPTPGLPGETSVLASAVPAPPQSAPNTFFRGPNGIRAGWRVLIFLLLVAAIAAILGIAIGIIVRLVSGPATGQKQFNFSTITPLGLASSEAGIFFTTVVAALFMGRIERRKFSEYGLPPRAAFQNHFWVGASWGFLAISGSLLGIFLLHGFHLQGLAIHGSTIVSALAAWSAAFILVGLAEEFAFRGYLQYTLTTGIGFWPAAILLSLLFGLAHAGNPGESHFGLVSVVLFGLLFCLFLRRTGNLWWAVGFHAGWDWGQTFFYGVPDSGVVPYHSLFSSSFSGAAWLTGGTVGPEASVFTPIVLGIVAILFASMYHGNRYEVRTSSVEFQGSSYSAG